MISNSVRNHSRCKVSLSENGGAGDVRTGTGALNGVGSNTGPFLLYWDPLNKFYFFSGILAYFCLTTTLLYGTGECKAGGGAPERDGERYSEVLPNTNLHPINTRDHSLSTKPRVVRMLIRGRKVVP